MRNRFLYVTPRYFRYLSQTVVLTPWLMGLFSLYLLAFVPQMQEIYISVIEDNEIFRGMLGLVTLCGFSALLYFWNHAMVTKRIDGIYPDHADIYFDRGVTDIRDLKTMISSALPFTGLAIGLLAAFYQARNAARHVKEVAGALGGGLDQSEALQARLQTLPGAILVCLAITLCVSVILILALHLSRNNPRWQRRFQLGSYVLTVLLVATPILFSDFTLKASRFAGPLAGTGFALLAGAVFLRALIWALSRAIWVFLTLPSLFILSIRDMRPALRQLLVVLIPMAAAGLMGEQVLGFLYEEAAAPSTSIVKRIKKKEDLHKASNEHRAQFAQTFASWLHAREFSSGDYPVFIVTAEGGGIYAASAASFFLANMEERCPGFAEHVFAISAVSGGSIGAALFDAALSERPEAKDASRIASPPPGCLEPKQPGALFERLRKITRDDYLSPVIAYILPDLVRDIREVLIGAPEPGEPCKNEVPFAWFGRDQMLEKSFLASFSRSTAPKAATVCPLKADANMLLRNFGDAWSPGGKPPALLLNATWVETGFRVAFSPFSLELLGEGTLYAFDELADVFGKPGQQLQNPSLIEAATVSARFPFIMPPWAPDPNSKDRWTFVDGGYADSSGVSTGLDLYNELKTELANAPELKGLKDASGKDIAPSRVKLYLILLTDTHVEADRRGVTGSMLDDFLAPFVTVMNMRDSLARRSFFLAYSQVGEVITIRLDQQTFPLPLGWKLSALSSDIIRFMMGRPDHCPPQAENGTAENSNWPVLIARHNSCELKRITNILAPLTPKTTPPPVQQAPSAQPAPPAPPQPVPVPVRPDSQGTWQPLPQ